MAVSNSGISELQARIRTLETKIKLTNSAERKQMYQEEIYELNDQIKNYNRKPSTVVPIKNAATVGDAIEKRLSSNISHSRLSNGRVLL